MGSGGASLKSVCRITTWKNHFHAQPERASIAVAAGSRPRAVWGGGGAKRRDQVVVPVFGDAGLEIAGFIDQEGTEIVRKLLGVALVAGIVLGVKKYLDNNPEAKRHVKEQANKAMGQAKHLAEGAGEKVKARTSQAQDQVDSFTDSGTPSTSSTSSATTNDPATGAPTTL
jgi:hypothetical protein